MKGIPPAGGQPGSRPRTPPRRPLSTRGSRLGAALADAQRFLRRDYVTGVGVGYAMKGGAYTKQIAICIHVSTKLHDSKLSRAQLFPRHLHGVRVDVVQLNIRPHLSDADFQSRQRTKADPLRPGIMVKTEGGAFGTIGLLVSRLSDGKPYILSSGHVFDAPGTRVFQPNKTLAPSSLGSVSIVKGSPSDAAIAQCTDRGTRNQPQGTNIRIRSVRRAIHNEVLKLSGAITGLTNGQVVWIGTKDIVYGPNDIRRVNGFQLKPASTADSPTARGDSGALWFDASGAAVGLHVGGDTDQGNSWSFACHLEDAMAQMALSL